MESDRRIQSQLTAASLTCACQTSSSHSSPLSPVCGSLCDSHSFEDTVPSMTPMCYKPEMCYIPSNISIK
ncbi:uncharacterized protein P174DRAFT_439906 [Aspergillus novofumigatus IBT 16806]|uniref:Uncharacterized protein n=1 Tax=Aspergillus novofumigatus (strain IBT 16806) TaxID=1392255 RepID=A0A2I1CCE1_ASPN1|nr:uncharacterized protein P174DRAFT_439906 [Aspergillus novofumigatus IBT 16806]PKX95285.1 hypothetical protein P174DRAFT_439906 [Aspergillus novofumigatus IBT 16806]